MRLWISSGLSLLLALSISACGSDGDEKDDGPTACTSDVDCINQANPCQIGQCDTGNTCVYEPGPDGPPVNDVEGDCRRATCLDGIPEFTPDNSDVGEDDDECTIESCFEGSPRQTIASNGSSCSIGRGSGSCQQGTCIVLCVEANTSSQCDDEDPCTEDICVPCELDACHGAGRCDHPPGDGVGPDDFNECTIDVCQAGLAAHEPAPPATPCSVGGNVCNAIGECVDCATDDDCADESVPTCFVPICDNGTCDSEPAPMGFVPEDLDTLGDCHSPICSGTGSLTTTVDDSDVPDDLNPCTEDSCMDGSQMNTYLGPGESCGSGGEKCNDYGLCCMEYVYPGATSDMLAIRHAFVSQYSSTPYLSRFTPATGATLDIETLDVSATQIAFSPDSGKVYYLNSSGVGVLADCGGTELEGLTLAAPNTVTAISNPGALAYDSTAGDALLVTLGGAGLLYGITDSSGAWAEVASMQNFDASAGTYSAATDRLYLVDSGWSTTLYPYTTAGVAETSVALSSALSTTGVSSVQLRADGSYLYYILQGYYVGSVYSFVQVDPADGTTTVIY